MLFATLVLAAAQPALPTPFARPLVAAPARAAAAPCNPDPMKSLGCTAQRHTPSARPAATVPMVCNSDPLKAAACHAHVALARADTRAAAKRDEELAAAD